MKLARKITLALFLGMCAVLAVHGYLRFQHDVQVFESDMQRDDKVMGYTLALAISDTWQRAGEEAALQLLRKVDAERRHVRIRWIWLEARPPDPHHPELPQEELEPLRRGEEVVRFERGRQKPRFLYLYIPVHVHSGRTGALELVESLQDEEIYLKATVRRILLTTGAIAGVSGLVAMVLGVWLVGKPIRILINKARRIGAGDLAGRLELDRRTLYRKLERYGQDSTEDSSK